MPPQREGVVSAGYDRDGRLRDDLGRNQLSRFNVLKWGRILPGLIAWFAREVPGDFWALDADPDGTEVAVIACPCGEAPRVAVGTMHECVCERFYLATRERVKVANSPQDRSAA